MQKEKLKSNPKAPLFVVLIIIAGLAVGLYGMRYIKEESSTVSNEEIVLEEGQYLQYAEIKTITGNEIVYTKIDYTKLETAEESENDYTKLGKPAENEKDYMKLEKPAENETDYPELGNPTKNEIGYPTSGNPAENMPERQRRQVSKKTAEEQIQESSQLQIPVGTDVITKLGTVTTFSRLASGNMVKMLMQNQEGNEETVLKIWIIE